MPSAWVTGAARGSGLAITQHLSAPGWDVYATARSDADLDRLARLAASPRPQVGMTLVRFVQSPPSAIRRHMMSPKSGENHVQ